jgi:hypothetical protein
VTPQASLPTDVAAPAAVVSDTLPAATISQGTPRKATPVDPLAAVHTRGIGPWPIILLGLIGATAALAGPRLPGLLSASWKPGCELERLRQSQLRSRQ